MSKEKKELTRVMFDFQETPVRKMSEKQLRAFALELRKRIAEIDRLLYDSPTRKLTEAEMDRLSDKRYGYAVVRSACFEVLDAKRKERYCLQDVADVPTSFISCESSEFGFDIGSLITAAVGGVA